MNIPEEFGKYLLLKKLTEDPLVETFRAGRVGTDGIEQVVLLRVFNGKGMDGEKLWQQVSGRNAVQQALRSPNIGTGVDLGRVRSYPYAAYDYISGKNLATLFAQATKQFSPIPTDHALLIAERPFSPRACVLGSALAVVMFLTTLSFLVTTPGVWEPSLGGFPALAALPGQFLIKDVALLGISLWSLGEAWRAGERT